MTDTAERQRIDKWLFFARIVKSRSLAQKMVRDGQVRLNGARVIRPSVDVGDGDRLVIALERRDLHLIVRAAGVRRGPYAEAQTLYEDVSPPPEAREALSAFEQAQRVPGSGRPTKKERRELSKLRGD
ncbi:RNA-binding S4 domain-containing protein [Martelella limonii]|uniref:RNA-binding S4 domain-containing protein n=1 Tax=Martelella limonii TaxID=1647649 RepID=UPI0015811F05|nr:RNA-binding S4 domain-containing protein [Martelella limonii]